MFIELQQARRKNMERPQQKWKAKMTLYRSVQSQPDLVTKHADLTKKAQLTVKQTQKISVHAKDRPHTAEAAVRFQELNQLRAKPTTRPNTAAMSCRPRSVSSSSSTGSLGIMNYSSGKPSAESCTRHGCKKVNAWNSYINGIDLSQKSSLALLHLECTKNILQTRGSKFSSNFGKDDIVKRVRAQSCKRRSAKLDPEERKKIVLTHRQTSEEKVEAYYRLLKEKEALEQSLASRRAVASQRFRKAIWKVLWVIRWKRAMIAISLDKMAMTAMEMDWHTRNTDAIETQFRREDYSRSRVSTRVPAWAEKILRKPPDWRSETERNKLHALMRPLKAFEKFTEKIQLAMCRAMRCEFVEAKRIILRKGHPGICFYFIYSGSVFVNVEDCNSNQQVFTKTAAILHRGESFGELALLKNLTRAATITCREDCELLTVDNTIFSVVCPAIFEQELQEKLEFIRCLPIFMSSMWSEESLSSLCTDGQIKQYKNNKVIVADNTLDDWLYICMEGKCKVIKCVTVQTEESPNGQLTNRSCEEAEKSAHLFSTIINEAGSDAQRWFSSPENQPADTNTSGESQAIFQKVQMLNSMALDWIWAREQVEEVRRRSKTVAKDQCLRISGVKTFSILMNELRAKAENDGEELVFLEIAELRPKDVFDIYAILRADTGEVSQNSHLILVSAGAKMVRFKQAELLKRATFEAIEYIKTITESERYPTETELLERYLVTHTWQQYKRRALSEALNDRCSETGSDFNKLYAKRLNTSTKLLQTLRLNDLVDLENGNCDDEERAREPFQFELTRTQDMENTDQQFIFERDSKLEIDSKRRREDAVGALPSLVEQLLVETKSSPPINAKV